MPKLQEGFVFLGVDIDVMRAVERLLPLVWEIDSPVDAVIACKVIVRAFLIHGAQRTGISAEELEKKIDKHVANVKIEWGEQVAPMPVTAIKPDGN